MNIEQAKLAAAKLRAEAHRLRAADLPLCDEIADGYDKAALHLERWTRS